MGASLAFADADEHASVATFAGLARKHCAEASHFYSASAVGPADFNLADGVLTFRSAVATETKENDIVRARIYPARRPTNAVVILPHWNAPMWGYARFCSYLVRLGLTAVELCLPYHGLRNRPDTRSSDYFLSANLGRTIRSVRQAVLDTRAVFDWLQGKRLPQSRADWGRV